MSALPPLFAEGRGRLFALVLTLGLGQATTLAVVAVATRHAFAGLHAGTALPPEVFAGLIGGGTAAALLHLAAGVGAERLGYGYSLSLRRVLYRHIAGMDPAALARRTLGGLSLRFVGDMSAARGWIGTGLARGIAAMAVLPGVIGVMFWLSPVLARAALVPLVLATALGALAAVGLGAKHRRLRRRRSRIAARMIERIAIAPALDLAGRTGRELAQFELQGRALVEEAASRRLHTGLLRGLPLIGAAVAAASVIRAAAAQNLPAAEVAAVLAALSLLHAPLADLAGMWDRWCAWDIARGRCIALLNEYSDLRCIRPRGAPVSVLLKGRETEAGFQAIHVPAGALAIIPASAAAAPEIARALAGMNPRASVTYDGTPDLPRIAMIGEEAAILRGTLRRNLGLGGGRRPSNRAVRAMAGVYGLEGALARFAAGRGRIAEAGRNLSADERLALQFTRAALISPDLIVLHHPAIASGDPRIAALHDETGATLVVIDTAGAPSASATRTSTTKS